MKVAVLQHLALARAKRRPMAMLTAIPDGESWLVERAEDAGDAELRAAVATGFRLDQSRLVRLANGREVFVAIHNPPLRMILVGAVHIAQAMIPLAWSAGYDVTVIDPRSAFASAERFEGVVVDTRWPDEALPAIGVDRRTAFVALTHDPRIDDPALTFALARDPFYVGALGSKKTSSGRRERMAAAGVSPTALARIHGPIGLDIGAVGASEIAISIMAEVTAVLRGKAA